MDRKRARRTAGERRGVRRVAVVVTVTVTVTVVVVAVAVAGRNDKET